MSTEATRKMSRDETAQNDGPPLAVHVAVMSNDLQKLQQLIQSGAPQLHPKTYETALHVAARTPALECLQWLLDNYINSPRDRDCNGSTACHYAVVYGNLEALKMLLDHDPKNRKELSEMKGENGLTIMGLATLQGDLAVVEWIVNNFPELAYLKDKSGNLPIHLAAAGGALEIVKFLIERYGKKYATESGSEKKFQPLYYAVDKGKTNVVKYLIDEVKVDPLARAKGGMTTLHAAVTAHQVSITKWLIEKLGPEMIVEKSDDGATLLHLAAAEGLPDLLQFFIESLPDKSAINTGDDIGSTPTHDAAEFGERETLLVLLKNGADITVKNQNGETPFDLAVHNSHNDLIAMLADYREKGTRGLDSYRPAKSSSERIALARTSRDEAEEITDLIQQTADIVEKRKEEEDNRKQSLLRLSEDDLDESDDDLDRQLMKDRESDRISRSKSARGSTEDFSAVPHEISPEGDMYAKIKKTSNTKLPVVSPVERDDRMSDVGSHVSSHRVARLTNSLDNHYQKDKGNRLVSENDSTSSVGTSVSRARKNEFHNGQRAPQHPYGYYPPFFQQQHMHHKRIPQSASASSLGSAGSGMLMYPPPPPPGSLPPGFPQYPYMPAMVAQYYGYPYPPQYYPVRPNAKGINDRIHMEALQKNARHLFVPPPGNYGPHPHKYGYFGGPKRSRPSSGRSGARSNPANIKAKVKHTDRAIGFGPATNDDIGLDGPDIDHPAPPPITKGGQIDHDPTELTHANFIMMKADEKGKVPTQASEGTRLQRAKLPDKYDGRFDNYIETDSEDEIELPDHVRVSALAESALILLMTPILGLKGLQKHRPEGEKLSPKAYDEQEAQRTSKHWSSKQDLAEKFNQPSSSTSKHQGPSDIDDWSQMLGLSLTTANPSQMKDISGSIRARNFAFQELKPSTLHPSQYQGEDEDNDDDIISVVIGDDMSDLKQDKHVKKGQARSAKQEKSSKREKSGKEKKKASGDKQETKKKSRSTSSSKEQKPAPKTKSSKKKPTTESGAKKTKKMIVKSSTNEEPVKEMKLKRVTTDSYKKPADVVTSVSVKTGGVKSKSPVDIPNVAVIDASDSDDDQKYGGLPSPSSQGSVNVEDIFAETEKEIEQMLAGMPRSPTVESGIDDELTSSVNPADKAVTGQENQQLEQLQGMFPHTTGQGEGNDELLSIIEALKMKPEDVTPQQKVRIQLIQKILLGKDPELRAQLLSLMSEGWTPVGDQMESTSSTQLMADIENKLLESQEKQRKETEEHFRSQAEFSETLQRRLEEQAARHMKDIQEQLDQQKKMMAEQLEEQRKLLEQERRTNRMKHKLSSDSDSDDELLVHATPHPAVATASRGRTSTMEAKIQHQSPLKWEDFNQTTGSIPDPPPLPSIVFLLSNVDDPVIKNKLRRTTAVEIEKTSRALAKFTSVDLLGLSEEEDDDDDDNDELTLAKAKLATRRKADIMKVQESRQTKSLEAFLQTTGANAAKTMVVS